MYCHPQSEGCLAPAQSRLLLSVKRAEAWRRSCGKRHWRRSERNHLRSSSSKTGSAQGLLVGRVDVFKSYHVFYMYPRARVGIRETIGYASSTHVRQHHQECPVRPVNQITKYLLYTDDGGTHATVAWLMSADCLAGESQRRYTAV